MGLQALVKTGLPVEGKRVVVAGSGPLLLAVAAYLRGRGADVLVDCRAGIGECDWRRFGLGLVQQKGKVSEAWRLRRELKIGFPRKGAKAQSRGVKYLTRCWPLAAPGEDKLESVTLFRRGKRWQVSCDYLACGFHLVPNVELAELLGCKVDRGACERR